MRARHSAQIRAGIIRGRAAAARASLVRKGRYPIHRDGTSDLQWRAFTHTIGRQLRGTSCYMTGPNSKGTLTIRAFITGGPIHPAPAGTEPAPPASPRWTVEPPQRIPSTLTKG